MSRSFFRLIVFTAVLAIGSPVMAQSGGGPGGGPGPGGGWPGGGGGGPGGGWSGGGPYGGGYGWQGGPRRNKPWRGGYGGGPGPGGGGPGGGNGDGSGDNGDTVMPFGGWPGGIGDLNTNWGNAQRKPLKHLKGWHNGVWYY